MLNADDGSIAQVFENLTDGSEDLQNISEIIAPNDGKFVYATAPDGDVAIFTRNSETGNLSLTSVQDLEAEFATIRQHVFDFDRGEFKGLSLDDDTGQGLVVALFTEVRGGGDLRSVLQRFHIDPTTGEFTPASSRDATSGQANVVFQGNLFPVYDDVEILGASGIALLSSTAIDVYSSSPSDPAFLTPVPENRLPLAPLGITTPSELVRSGEFLYVISETENAIATFGNTVVQTSTGGLRRIGHVETITDGVDGAHIKGPSDVATTSDGRYLFVSNQSDDSVSVFQRDLLGIIEKETVDLSLEPARLVQVLRDDVGGVSGLATPTAITTQRGGEGVLVAGIGNSTTPGQVVTLDNRLTVGGSLVQGPEQDQLTVQDFDQNGFAQRTTIIIEETPFPSDPGTLVTWSYTTGDDTVADFISTITPLLLEKSGDDWVVTGVGEQQRLATGTITSSFNLASGSDSTSDRYFGFQTVVVSPDINNLNGGVTYQEGTNTVTRIDVGRDALEFTPGQTLSGGTQENRSYSAQANAEVRVKTAALVAEFSDIESLGVQTASEDDTITVTNSGSSDVSALTIDTGSGSDAVTLNAAITTTTVNLGDGDDRFNAEFSDNATTTVNAGAGNDALSLDQVGTTATTVLNGESGSDVFAIQGDNLSPAAQTNVNGGTGAGDVLNFDRGSASNLLSPNDPTPNGSIGVQGLGQVDFTGLEDINNALAPLLTFTPSNLTAIEGLGGGSNTLAIGVTVDPRGTLDGDVVWDLDGDQVFDDAAGTSINLDWRTLLAAGINDDGVYTIRAAAANENGEATRSIDLTITDVAPTILVPSQTTGETGEAFTIDLSTIDPGPRDSVVGWRIDWDGPGGAPAETFGDIASASHTYTQPGNYQIDLEVIDDDSSPSVAATLTHNVSIDVGAGTLSVDATAIAEGDAFNLFVNTSSQSADLIRWDVDNDGEFDDASGQAPFFDWEQFQGLQTAENQDQGSFPIRAQLTFGSTVHIVSGLINVANANPTATGLINSGPVQQGQTAEVSFDNPSDPANADQSSLTYSFDFGDDGSFEITGSNNRTADVPASFLTAEGSVLIRGKITDKDGGETEFLTTLQIGNNPPTVTLTPSAISIDEGDTFSLSINVSDPSDLPLTNLQIDWGVGLTDAINDSSTSTDHIYRDNGARTVTFSFDRDNVRYTESVQINVGNVDASANILSVTPATGQTTLIEGNEITLAIDLVDPGADDTINFIVDWGDGDSETLSDLSPGEIQLAHTYADDGTYQIQYTTQDDDGLVVAGTHTVVIENVSPQIVFDSSTQDTTSVLIESFESDEVTLNAIIVDSGINDTYDVTIDFGDGTAPTLLESVGTDAIGAAISQPYVYADDPENADDKYDVTITIVDENDSSSTATATTSIVARNLAPVIETFDGGDAQDSANTIAVGQPVTINATYSEQGADDTVTFEINWGDGTTTTDATLTFDPATNQGTIVATHVYQADGVYPISVRLSDNDGGISNTLTSTAFIGELTNVAPTLSLENTVTNLAEDTSVSQSTRVADIVITDEGLGTNELTLTGPDAELFEINGDQLSLRANAILNPEDNPVLDVTINVDDTTVGATPDATASLSIAVDYTLNTPPVASDLIVNVDENTSAIGTVTATDADDDTLSYLIVSGNDDGLFQIDQLTGEISVTPDRELDFETTPNEYSLEFQVADNGSPARSDLATVTINVDPINDNAPVFTSTAQLVTPDNSLDVLTLSATDADLPTQNVTFTVAGTGPDDDQFEIVGDQLRFKTAPQLANPTDVGGTPGDNIYFVTVLADDGNGRVTEQELRITVDISEITVTTTEDELDSDSATATIADFGGVDDISLREAIVLANQGSINTINFDLPGTSTQVINIDSPLPTITDAVTIDGTTQTGYVDSPVVQIDAATNIANGLLIESGGSQVEGLSITGFADALEFVGGNGNTALNNYLGLDPTGAADGNNVGLRISGSEGNVVDGNVISGNNASGVVITGTSSTGNRLINNLIGLDPTGEQARPNAGAGIVVNSPDNIIGEANAGNVISGNAALGVSLNSDATGTVIQANKIGTNQSGDSVVANGSFGLSVRAENTTVGGDQTLGEGNQISGNARHGVLLANASGSHVVGNLIGTNSDGTAALGNGSYGVYVVNTDNATVGSTQSGHGNVISGNDLSGVILASSSNSHIQGNRIGTNSDGTNAVGNDAAGVALINGSTGNTVSDNQVAGNGSLGILINSETSENNHIHSNLIGTNADGTAALNNRSFGVLVRSPNNTIGGDADQGNVVSATSRGIVLSGENATGNTIAGNFIGTNQDSTADLGMTTGVQFAGGASGNTLGPANVIANNDTGVRLLSSSGSQNQITQNSFVNNSVIGIDLAGLGPTANDANDADAGANRGQNYPVIDAVAINSANLNVTFSVPTSTENATYDLTIEVYKSNSAGEGIQYLGSVLYTAGNQGAGVITRAMSGVASAAGLLPGDLITATATDAAGNTSEFATPVAIPGGAATAASRSAFDVSADGNITARDALLVINRLGNDAEGESISQIADVNRDGNVTALDALQVINWIGRNSQHDPNQESQLFSASVDQVLSEIEEDELIFDFDFGSLF